MISDFRGGLCAALGVLLGLAFMAHEPGWMLGCFVLLLPWRHLGRATGQVLGEWYEWRMRRQEAAGELKGGKIQELKSSPRG
jgi:hypothetical protein